MGHQGKAEDKNPLVQRPLGPPAWLVLQGDSLAVTFSCWSTPLLPCCAMLNLLSPQRYQTLLKQDSHVCLLQNPVQKQWEMLLHKPCHSQSSAAGGPGHHTPNNINPN